MNKLQACSVCGTVSEDFMMLVAKAFTVTMCHACWVDFTDKAPIDVLEMLFKVEWRSVDDPPDHLTPPELS